MGFSHCWTKRLKASVSPLRTRSITLRSSTGLRPFDFNTSSLVIDSGPRQKDEPPCEEDSVKGTRVHILILLASGPPAGSLRYTAFAGLLTARRSPHALLASGPPAGSLR